MIIKNKALLASGLAVLLAGAPTAFAQPPLTVQDSRGKSVVFPNGARSFADRVVNFKKGAPWTNDAVAQNPASVLGIPNYNSTTEKDYLTLGNNGSVVLEFTDNYLVNVAGPDLWVFEIGPNVEATKVAISKDGVSWIEVGQVSGGTAGIDIGPKVKAGDRFSFVRLTDTGKNNFSDWPGADIDAVGAIGSIVRNPTPPPAPQKPTTPPAPNPNVPTKTDEDCKNFLRIEMKDGTFIMLDMRKVARMMPVSQ